MLNLDPLICLMFLGMHTLGGLLANSISTIQQRVIPLFHAYKIDYQI